MADPTTGFILAALDVDVDNGAAWNRWYDLEHLAPNIALPGISTGRRYVAPPGLHASRRVAAGDPVWGSGRTVKRPLSVVARCPLLKSRMPSEATRLAVIA